MSINIDTLGDTDIDLLVEVVCPLYSSRLSPLLNLLGAVLGDCANCCSSCLPVSVGVVSGSYLGDEGVVNFLNNFLAFYHS